MPIIAKPASIQKNVPASFSLDKTALAAVPSVVADSYFSDSTNWSKVLLFYKSNAGNQKEVVSFDATQTSPIANFLASEKARDIFEIQKIIITDFDDGVFEISRSQLTTSEFDVDMTPPAPVNNITWNFVANPNYSLNAQNEIVSSYTSIDFGIEKILFSQNQYTIPTNGLEFKIKADNGFLTTNAESILASDTGPSVFGGFTIFGLNAALGVQNAFSNIDPFTYPSTPEIEWKIIIKSTETLFYINNSLIDSKVNIANSQVIYLALRFDNSHNVKEYSLIEL